MSEYVNNVPVHLDIVVERLDSALVPWSIVEDASDYPESLGNEWSDLVGLFETDTWEVPVENPQVGERYRCRGNAAVMYSKSWTDWGYEYDVDLEWGDDAITVCHVVNGEISENVP